MYAMKDFIYDIKYFDGTEECAQQLVEWAGEKARRATTDYGAELLLINTYGDDWFAVSGDRYIVKDSDGDLTSITAEEFESKYIKI